MKIPLLVQVAGAHLASHLHIMTVPALLPLLPDAMGLSFLELGVAIGVFNVVSALVQAPLGFAVDRFGARRLLCMGMLLGSASFMGLALWGNSTTLLIAMALAGLANGVYHPADYALLSRGVAPGRMGRAFSVHTFAGYLGSALAPGLLLGTAYMSGSVHVAFMVSSVVGLLAMLPLLLGRQPAVPVSSDARAGKASSNATSSISAASLLTPAVLSLTFLYVMLSMSTGGIDRFSVTALINAYDTPLSLANAGLTAYLFASAAGVLLGGILADRTHRHDAVASGAFAVAAVLAILLATVAFTGPLLVVVMGTVGLMVGIVAPSRDMLVRAAAPPEAQGRVFGVVSTGFNIGGAVGPVLFGWMLDQGHPQAVFWAAATFMALTVVTISVQHLLSSARRARCPDEAAARTG